MGRRKWWWKDAVRSRAARMWAMLEIILGAGVVFVGVSILTGVRQLQEYERAVIFRLGRARKELASPGLNFLLPWGIDRARVVDIRTKAIQIPPQEIPHGLGSVR